MRWMSCFTEEIGTAWFSQITMSSPTPSTATSPGTDSPASMATDSTREASASSKQNTANGRGALHSFAFSQRESAFQLSAPDLREASAHAHFSQGPSIVSENAAWRSSCWCPHPVENQAVPISSVQHDIHRIGYTGAALLDRLMNGGKPPPAPILVKPSGVAERASTDTLAISSDTVRRVRDIFMDDMANPPSTEQLAERFGVSRAILDRAFADDVGLSPSKMLMRLRLDEAKRLMAATDLTLAEIAARLGYCNAAYFTNIFRDSEGVAPKEWRKRQR